MRWFRFYSEALDDPKVQRLSGELFKAWVNLLCLANDGTPRGTLPSIEDIGFRLRLSPAKTRTIIDDLVSRGLIDAADETLQPHNWDDRQAKSDNVAERVQKHRAKQQEAVTRNVTYPSDVTTQIKNREDTDTDETEDLRPPVAVAPAAEKTRPVPKPARKPRAPDVHWDTQVEIFGFAPTPETPEHDRWQKSTGIWRKLKATPEQMHLAADLYRQEFPTAAFTVIALAGRAEQLLKGHKPNPPPRVEDLKNPMMQSLATVDLSDITAEEAERDSRRHLQAQNGRSGFLPTAPRRIGDGGQPPQPDVLPAARQSRHG